MPTSAPSVDEPYTKDVQVSRENVTQKFDTTLELIRSRDASLRRLIIFFLHKTHSICETTIKSDLDRLSSRYQKSCEMYLELANDFN